MWKQNSNDRLTASIDENHSWVADDLVPEVCELSVETLVPRSIPIRVSPLTAKCNGFVFPEARQWLPAETKTPEQAGAARKKKKPKRAPSELSLIHI